MRISDWSSDVCSSDLAGGEIIERFFDISPVPLCVIDGALRFRMVNEAAASIIGLPAASLTGHPVTNIIPKTKTLLEECFRCVRNGEPLADQQLAWQGRHYQLIFGVLRDQSFIGLSIAVIDVTRRRSEEHTSELQTLMRISYAGCCLK